MARLAVLGHPVSHSRSPAMQNAALAALGLTDWSYEAIDVTPDGFAELVRQLPDRGFVGVNVTVPHKEAALAAAGEATDAATAIGAANTLTFDEGVIRADNTDAPGLIDAIGKTALASGGRALVLGAGGAGRAVVWALIEAGFEVSLWNRTASRAEKLAAEIGAEAAEAEPGVTLDPGPFSVIVNASAAGLGDGDGLARLPLDPGGFHSGQTVVDMVYGETPGTLLETAGLAGAETVDGLEILVRQGARSLEIWTGRQPDLQVMRDGARAT